MIGIILVGHEQEYYVQTMVQLFYPHIPHQFICDIQPQGMIVKSILTNTYCKAEVYEDGRLVTDCTYEFLLEHEGLEETRRQKRASKKLRYVLYQALYKKTGMDMPWGALTGIRPTKLVHELWDEGISTADIEKIFEVDYCVTPEKIKLMVQVAEIEKDILIHNTQGMVSIYIGIPFCPTRCLYCSFTSYALDTGHQQVDAYMEALFKEIAFIGNFARDLTVQSLYIGGGTPTSLNEVQLKNLLDTVSQHFDINTIEEFTVEAGRPDTITEKKLQILKQYGVTRISINPQTMNEETLKRIGRKHTAEDIIQTMHMAKEVGHTNINMDVILGLPGETPEHIRHTMTALSKLQPQSMTVHTLAVKRASRLKENMEEYKFTESYDMQKMLDIAYEEIIKMGMHPYYLYRQKNMVGNFENVGYCLPGKECIYNVQIMEEKQTILALGAGAITKTVDLTKNRIERIFNVKSVEEYIKRIDEMIERKRDGLRDL